ncbi:BTAD domain-containing putative transcriptional regulator [Umezawaea endophytica]|uniref:AAA family ATPase n=1 Tax=Umezawaea endophytica TaxID=1654476 RepID=A0A9X2VHM8_9PSEU|nr:BTAD domain-containing putative transcriptional regulator [Umezawaea endophytica]MCS7476815.1 AAA family ATPase [Umezawaea endophytica]
MRFLVLGPLQVVDGDRTVVIRGLTQRSVLGFLLLNANRVVATSRLLKALWPDDAPPSARQILQNAVSNLRRALSPSGSVVLSTRAPGYELSVPTDAVDLFRFQRLVEEGRAELAAGAPVTAAVLLREALALWRGSALADLVENGVRWPELEVLRNARLDAVEDYFGVVLQSGRHQAVLAELETEAECETSRERLSGQLMLALYRCGRQTDALAVYRRTRTALIEEVGLEPSHELRRLEQAILTHDPSLMPAEPAAPVAVVRRDAPAVEHGHEVELLRGVAARVGHRARPHLVTLLGVPGVGKTRLVEEARCRFARDGMTVLVGRTGPFAENAGLTALGEVIAAHCGIRRDDPTAVAFGKLEQAVQDVVDRDDADRVLLALGALVLSPGWRVPAGEVLSAWGSMVGRIAATRPLVVVVEDLHDAEEAVVDFVQDLTESVGQVPLLVIVTAGLDLLARRPGWGGGGRQATTVTLDPLPTAEETSFPITHTFSC